MKALYDDMMMGNLCKTYKNHLPPTVPFDVPNSMCVSLSLGFNEKGLRQALAFVVWQM